MMQQSRTESKRLKSSVIISKYNNQAMVIKINLSALLAFVGPFPSVSFEVDIQLALMGPLSLSKK